MNEEDEKAGGEASPPIPIVSKPTSVSHRCYCSQFK